MRCGGRSSRSAEGRLTTVRLLLPVLLSVSACQCGAPCTSSADCGSGRLCLPSGLCAAPCTNGVSCIAGEKCSSAGGCVPAGSCGADPDCAPGQLCQAGACGAACTPTSCGAGRRCAADGHCVVIPA